MNREPFGKKCSCDHLESEHNAENKTPKIESITQDYRYILPLAQAISEFVRTTCRVCNCKQFNPEKKGWEF